MSTVSWQHAGQTECPLCYYVNEWSTGASTMSEGETIECEDCRATLTCVGHDIFDGEDGGSPSGAWIWEATPRARTRDEIALADARARHEESPHKRGEV